MGLKHIGLLLAVLVFALGMIDTAPAQVAQTQSTPAIGTLSNPGDSSKNIDTSNTQSLFDGKSLGVWEATEFGGEGDVSVVEGCIVMTAGAPLTAINLPESFSMPKINYEIQYDAMKVEGTDFFGTLTFPVNDKFCSLVIGGWAGTVVGLSSIDGLDASENETRQVRKFERNRWYQIRVRVTPKSIVCWIDQQRVVDQLISGKTISLRSEMIPCRPLGIANFYTVAKIRNVRLTKIDKR